MKSIVVGDFTVRKVKVKELRKRVPIITDKKSGLEYIVGSDRSVTSEDAKA